MNENERVRRTTTPAALPLLLWRRGWPARRRPGEGRGEEAVPSLFPQFPPVKIPVATKNPLAKGRIYRKCLQTTENERKKSALFCELQSGTRSRKLKPSAGQSSLLNVPPCKGSVSELTPGCLDFGSRLAEVAFVVRSEQ